MAKDFLNRHKAARPKPKPKGAKRLSLKTSSQFFQHLKDHKTALRVSFKVLTQNSLSAWLTILAIGIILVLPLSGYLFYHHMNQLHHTLDKGNQLTAFVHGDLSTKKVNELIQNLKAIEEVQTVTHQTPQSALEEFEQKTNLGDLVALLPSNPLPHVLIITPKDAYQTLPSVEALKVVLEAHPDIDQVIMDLDWVKKIEALNHLIAKIVSMVIIFIGIGCVVILTNTIRLNLEKHREELYIFSLMGATDAYIRRPFVYRAVIYGILGATTAYGLVFLGLRLLQKPTEALAELYRQVVQIDTIPIEALFSLIVFSVFLSVLSAKLAIWQYNERLR